MRIDPPSPQLVSVVIPCHNAAEYVAETIESVLSQTYPEIEVIVVDDASTDESPRIIASFGEKVASARLDENIGGSAARNRGAALASGYFLMFLDADDRLAPHTIEALVEALRARPDGTAVSPRKRLVRSASGWDLHPAEVPLPDPSSDPLAEWLGGHWVPPCAVLWRREVYDRTGGWDESLSYNDDGDLMMRAFLAGAALVVASGGEAHYRFHGDSRLSVGTDLSSMGKLRSGMRVMEKLAAELEMRRDLDRYSRALSHSYRELAIRGFQHGHTQLARECLRRAQAHGGGAPASPTVVGRILERFLGLERKETLARALGRLGIMTPGRRLVVRRARLAAQAGNRDPA